MNARKGLKLVVGGVLLGLSMFFIGGIGVVPAHSPPATVAQLQPWLEKTMCDYRSVDCTSRGPVVTSPASWRGGA